MGEQLEKNKGAVFHNLNVPLNLLTSPKVSVQAPTSDPRCLQSVGDTINRLN